MAPNERPPSERRSPNGWTWAARASGAACALFLGLFAFDTLEEPGSLGEKLGALALHLFPTWLCLFGVAIAWRREWIGGVTFAALALAYAVWAHAHPDWILVVGGPLLLVAVLHLLAWNRRRANAAH